MSKIYFARVGDAGPIKIGITAGNPDVRLASLQVGCPYPLKLMGSVAGTQSNEQALHRRLALYWMTGEWFEPSAAVVDCINEVLRPGYVWPAETVTAAPNNKVHQSFLADIENHLTRTNMTATAFGRTALNDPNFVGDVRAGRMPNLGLVARVHDFIRSHEASPA